MAEDAAQAALQPVDRPLNLIPVGLKEAALDSPTFRATALHFSDQIEIVERWLEGYVKAASKLGSEVNSLESLVNSFLTQSAPPSTVSEAVLDHDYTLLALQRYGEGAREFWQYTLRGMKKYDTTVIDPIKGFLNNELRTFKEARRAMEGNQKAFDSVISRYLGQSKTKEASSLREDAFQLYEARKAYVKAAMDFCVLAPQLRATLDKLIVRIFAEQWKEMRTARDANTSMFTKGNSEMERVRGWSKEMENSERAFKRELLTARRQIEDNAEQLWRPSRELEDYSASTVPYLGTGAAASSTGLPAKAGQEKSEKQGWLFMKTVTGKPARTVWSRRWFFVKNGIFGWLIQGVRSGGVEESEKIGVLLCGVRPAFQEERRFCLEIKTKDTSIILQAETQAELTEWIAAFEVAKRKALEDPASTETSSGPPGVDPAFAISPPVAPEFAAKMEDRHGREGSEEISSILGVPERAETMGHTPRASVDGSSSRRVMSLEREGREGEGTREHAARIIQKLDLHKRATASPQLSQGPASGGIASLINASHTILPVGPGAPAPTGPDLIKRNFTMPASTLAPSTLANPPAPTNLSHQAVIYSSERGTGSGRSDSFGGAISANSWGSSNWGHVSRLLDDPKSQPKSQTAPGQTSQDDSMVRDGMAGESLATTSPNHRKTLSVGFSTDAASAPPTKTTFENVDDFPNYYPLQLKAQQAQFRMLFPGVSRAEKVVLVFRATWNPNEQQEFPGRVYVTTKEIYFYSHHIGLVLITSINLASVTEVTAAPGRDCDFLYLHLKETERSNELRRITVKTFLEPLKLLQRRLNFLVHNVGAEQPISLEEVLKTLIKMETEEPKRSSSVESWEDVSYSREDPNAGGSSDKRERNVKTSLRIDGSLFSEPARTGKEIAKFKLPSKAVEYAPQGMQVSLSRDFNVSAKALFHVMFGDKSAVFQLLYCNRWADKIVQTPWTKDEAGHLSRRFESESGRAAGGFDVQTIDILSDHLCYVVANVKSPWRLPYSKHFSLTTKVVITHAAKSRCRLAIYQHVAWRSPPKLSYIRHLVEKQAFSLLNGDALDLSNVSMDQVAKLGHHSKTNKAIEIFGAVGQQTQIARIDAAAVAPAIPSAAIARSKRTKKSLFSLLVEDVVMRVFGLFGMSLDILVAVGKGIIGVCTAHTLLVIILAVSALYNTWYGYRDGLGWWRERSATRFMGRIGVKPDLTIGRAVWLRDVEDMVAAPTLGGENGTFAAMVPSSSSSGTCRSTFSEQLSTSMDLTSSKPTAARLGRSRDSLARYRHDLLVALRVVNRVENDVVQAEWEEWVRAEGRKCARVEGMLKAQHSAKGKKSQARPEELDRELGDEFEKYCASCRMELEGIGKGAGLM